MGVKIHERNEIRKLGSGGFGETILFEDSRHHRFVLKSYKPVGSNDSPKALAMFKAECDRLSEVGNHPQIPGYLGFEEAQDNYAIAQQYIPGRSLRQLLDEEGTFGPTQALQLLEQLLDPLAHLHQNRIIHRDIKPDNIIISLDSNLPVIVDFGAAKLVSETVLAQTGTVIGTANYAAPEQLAGQTCFQSDIYSLGLTVIELLTGIQPFEQVDMHTGDSIWFAKANGVSKRFADILNKMTARFLRDRYSSVEEVRDAIYRFRLYTDQQVQEQREKAELWRSRRRFVLRRVAPVVAAVGLTGAGSLALWNAIDQPVIQFVKETSERVFPEDTKEPQGTSEDLSQVKGLIEIAFAITNMTALILLAASMFRVHKGIVRDGEIFSRISLLVAPAIMLILLNTVGKSFVGELSSQILDSSSQEQVAE